MPGHLHALVTFGTQGQRNTAQNAVLQWVADWDAAHPTTPMTGTCVAETYVYPADDEVRPGVSARALRMSYTCATYAGVEAAMQAFADGVTAASYWDVVNMSTWLTGT